MKPREKITRGRLRAQISFQQFDGGMVCVFCPAEVSEGLYQHFITRHISALPPRPAIFSRFYPLHQVIVSLSSDDQASAEVGDFVAGMPEICFERDVA